MIRVVVLAAVLALGPQARAEPPRPEGRAPERDVAALRAPVRRGGPDLALRLSLAGGGPLAVEPERARETTPPPCVADFCQPRVDVPGIDGLRRRPSRTELVVSLLDRSEIEPIASIAWFFVVTGLRVDWTPAAMDESFGATAGGWGNVFVRLRVRIDPWNVPALPVRPKVRMRRERELAAERARAEDAERLRHLVVAASQGT